MEKSNLDKQIVTTIANNIVNYMNEHNYFTKQEIIDNIYNNKNFSMLNSQEINKVIDTTFSLFINIGMLVYKEGKYCKNFF